MPDPADGGQSISELVAAARAVVDEWGDGDEIDPDRMDGRIERLRRAVAS